MRNGRIAARCSDTLSEALAIGTAPAAESATTPDAAAPAKGARTPRRVDADELVDMVILLGSQKGAWSHVAWFGAARTARVGSSTSLSARGGQGAMDRRDGRVALEGSHLGCAALVSDDRRSAFRLRGPATQL